MKKIIIAAITLDGKIAKHADENVNWTSKKDKEFFRSETRKAGVVIFGANTYAAIKARPLPERLNIIMTHHPQKYQEKQKEGLLEFTDTTPARLLANLAQRGYTKVIIGGGSTIYSLFLQQNLVDEIYLTITPKIFGHGVSLFSDINIDELDLDLREVKKLGPDEILLKYRVKSRNF